MRGSTRFEAGEESYLASVSDLMVGMLFIFIIMLMAFALNYRSAEQEADGREEELSRSRAAIAAERDQLLERDQALEEVTAELAQQEESRTELLRNMTAELVQDEVPVMLDAANGVLRLPESLLFDSAEAALRPEGEEALGRLATTLAAALPCYSQAPAELQTGCPGGARPILEAVLVEGHSDQVPLRGGAFPDNWQLSAARGVSTFKAVTRFAPELERLRNVRGEALLGVSAYEARRPVASGETEAGRRLNRRIDLRFIMAAPTDAELSGMSARLDGRSEAAGP